MSAISRVDYPESQSFRSAVSELQQKMVAGALSESDLCGAIETDIQHRVVLSEVFLTKFLRATKLSPVKRDEVLSKIQSRMSEVLFTDPTLFLNYSKAAVLLAGKSIPLV